MRKDDDDDIFAQYIAIQTIQKAGVTLNLEKCEFSRQRLTFLGHVIDKEGVSPDPKKTSAIAAMPKPTT